MDIRLLEEFVNLVETCSFQETAEKMNMSQSSLTKHIHKLEEELEVSFFDRSTRAVQLNAFSRAYYPYARQILQLHNEAGQALTDIRNELRNELRIAFTPSLGRYDLVEMLSAFSRRHPQYNLKFTESPQVIDLLNSCKCDFGFLPESDSIDSNINQLIYKTDHLAVVLSDANPLASEEYLTVEKLRKEPMILHTIPTGIPFLETRKFLNRCLDKDITPYVAAEISHIGTILKMVQDDRGVTILNRMSVPEDMEGIVIVDLQPTIPFYIHAVYPSKRKKTAATSAFLRFIIEYITDTESPVRI